MITCKYQFFTFVIIWYHFFHMCSHFSTNFSHVWGFGTDSSHWCKLSTNSSHLRKIEPVRICTNSSQLKMWKMWNLSTDFRPPKLSKLTIRKFLIFQKWRLCTNSSHGVKVVIVKFAVRHSTHREHSGLVVECLTRGRGVVGSNLIGVTSLCPWARHVYHCLVLVQPRKIRPDKPEKLLTWTYRIKLKTHTHTRTSIALPSEFSLEFITYLYHNN